MWFKFILGFFFPNHSVTMTSLVGHCGWENETTRYTCRTGHIVEVNEVANTHDHLTVLLKGLIFFFFSTSRRRSVCWNSVTDSATSSAHHHIQVYDTTRLQLIKLRLRSWTPCK